MFVNRSKMIALLSGKIFKVTQPLLNLPGYDSAIVWQPMLCPTK